jgi:RNA-directed DNA polymerase
LAAAFDRIDHNHLLSSLGGFPAWGLVAKWLKAGVVEKEQFAPSEEGTPQGGVISPCLLNIALHGMEYAVGVRYYQSPRGEQFTKANSPVLVRYADDLVVFCASRTEADQVKDRLARWLAPRGLAFNEDKTQIVHLDDGFDFLGFNVRRYQNKLLIKPSKAAMRRIRQRLTAEMRSLRGANVAAVLTRLNPIIRGWSAYYRSVVASEAFANLDSHMWRLTYRWARRSHGNKSRTWVTHQYFGMFHKSRRNRWVFGDRQSGAYLVKFAWTKIVRHQMVKGASSPDDPALTAYWAGRRRRHKPPLDGLSLRLLRAQRGRCQLCGQLLLLADHEPQDLSEWETWLTVTRKALRKKAISAPRVPDMTDDPAAIQLVHTQCWSRRQARTSPNQLSLSRH